jgi:hypothetical protein
MVLKDIYNDAKKSAIITAKAVIIIIDCRNSFKLIVGAIADPHFGQDPSAVGSPGFLKPTVTLETTHKGATKRVLQKNTLSGRLHNKDGFESRPFRHFAFGSKVWRQVRGKMGRSCHLPALNDAAHATIFEGPEGMRPASLERFTSLRGANAP